MARAPSLAKWLIGGLVFSALVAYLGVRELGQLNQVPVVCGLVVFTITVDVILKKLSPPRKRYPCSWCGRYRSQ